ncbi:hypothetical protein [Chryseobacterium sp. CT-SW4]|uniref:hypothetical protein n=1 Tax=Chryseobacterium sp. SW-1 TaxID=3157343 RepID=UPI003B014FF4
MKKTLLLAILSISFLINAQTGKVGINTSSPTENLHVNGTLRLGSLPTNGTANSIYTINSSTSTNGTSSTTKDQTFTQDKILVVDANGVVGKADIPTFSSSGPTKFISGIILAIYNGNSGGILDPSKVIGGAAGTTYTVGSGSGTVTLTSRVGALYAITGSGYKVSQVSAGIFDIKFDTPFTEVYSLNANLYDTGTGSTPNRTTPSNSLSTLDQLQISYIDNSTIRIKTGNSAGNVATRSFTFSISGT